jgi:hypothetical protein
MLGVNSFKVPTCWMVAAAVCAGPPRLGVLVSPNGQNLIFNYTRDNFQNNLAGMPLQHVHNCSFNNIQQLLNYISYYSAVAAQQRN